MPPGSQQQLTVIVHAALLTVKMHFCHSSGAWCSLTAVSEGACVIGCLHVALGVHHVGLQQFVLAVHALQPGSGLA